MSQQGGTQHVAHLLPAFAAETLDGAERRRVLAHLARCPACRAERAAWDAIGAATRQAFREEPPDEAAPLRSFWARIDAAAGDEHTTLPPSTARPRPAASATIAAGPGDRGAAHRGGRSWRVWPILDAAAVLVLIAGIALLAGVTVGGDEPLAVLTGARDDPPPTPSPAVPRPEPGVVFDLTLPQEALPPLDPVQGRLPYLEVDRTEWAPGATRDDPGGRHGTVVRCVVAGSYTVQLNEPGGQIVPWPDDGEAAPLPAGEEATLETGWCLLRPAAVAGRERNAGDERLVLLEADAVLTTDPTPPAGTGGIDVLPLLYASAADGPDLWTGPLRVRLERHSIGPGEAVPAAPGEPPIVEVAPEIPGDQLGLTMLDDVLLNRLDRSIPVVVLTLGPAEADEAATMRRQAAAREATA